MMFETALQNALGLVVNEAMQTGTKALLALLRSSSAPAGFFAQGPLKGQDDQILTTIIQKVRESVPPALEKFFPYYIRQIAKGKLSLWTFNDDKERLEKTLDAFVKASRKATWTASKNIYDHQDWKVLERELLDFGAFNDDYGAPQEEMSVILHTKTIIDKNKFLMAKLAGIPMEKPPQVTYWFRKILTVQGAIKYGKGTTWCTASTQASTADGQIDYANHTAAGYLKNSGLYIIEMQNDATPRRPILQASGFEFRGVGDVSVGGLGPRLKTFIKETLETAGGHIDQETRQLLVRLAM